MGYNQYSIYRFTKDSIRFYHNAHPYTHLRFIIGQRREQVFWVEHSQNIRKKFNFGFHYMRFATEGAYLRQQTRHNDIAFTTRFDSKKRYLLKTLLIFNSIRADENGGIKETGIFKDTSLVSKQLVDVELPEADNRRRDIYFHAHQSWVIGKLKPVQDTLAQGFEAMKTGSDRATPSWQLYHELEAGREKYEYSDANPDSAYYGLFYLRDSSGYDYNYKTQMLLFGSRLGAGKHLAGSHRLGFWGDYSFYIIEQDGFPVQHVNELAAGVSFLGDTSAAFSYGASARYSFRDYTSGDFQSDAFLACKPGRAGKIQANVTYSRTEPGWIFHRFSFGEIRWNIDYGKQSDFSAGLSCHVPGHHFRFSVRFHHIDNLAFWDANRLPAQKNGSLQAWVFELRKLFRIRYFCIDNLLRVQLVSDKNLLRYPLYWGVHSLYYERGVFKEKLLTKFGIDIRYNTGYKAYAYFPLTGQFHLQDAEKLSFYPVMDIYVCFKIQTVRLFLIVNHVNQGMFGEKGYFAAYKYPADDRHFRFGLSWMFLD